MTRLNNKEREISHGTSRRERCTHHRVDSQPLTLAKTAFHLFLILLNLTLRRASARLKGNPDTSFVEGKLWTDELPSFSNRKPGGGSSGVRVSGGRVTVGIDDGGESRIVVSFTFSPKDIGAVVIRMTICLMLFLLVLVPCDLTSPDFLPNSVQALSSDGSGGGWFSSIAVRAAQFLFDVTLLLVELGKGTDVSVVFGGESPEVGGGVCEVVGMEGTFSLPADDERTILGILALREFAKEGRFRRPSSPFRLAPGSRSSPELFTKLGSILLVTPLPAEWESVVALATLLIEPALLIFAKLSFLLTGMTTASPPSPKRENLGIGSVTDIQFSLGSREIEGGRGWLDKAEAESRAPAVIGRAGKGGNGDVGEMARSSLVPRR